MSKNKIENGASQHIDHSQKAYTGLRRMLYYKDLVPGQKIAYRELAERLNMSPTPIIQALKWLEMEGFVSHEPNRGYYMTPFSLSEVEEIYELRQLLEPSLLPGTIANLDKAKIKILKKSLYAHLSAGRESFLRERLFKNTEFHLTLASLSEKKTQLHVLQTIFDLLLLKYGGNYLPIQSMETSDQEHKMIFDCMVSGDVKGAKTALSKHIGNVKKQVLKNLKRILEEREVPIY